MPKWIQLQDYNSSRFEIYWIPNNWCNKKTYLKNICYKTWYISKSFTYYTNSIIAKKPLIHIKIKPINDKKNLNVYSYSVR